MSKHHKNIFDYSFNNTDITNKGYCDQKIINEILYKNKIKMHTLDKKFNAIGSTLRKNTAIKNVKKGYLIFHFTRFFYETKNKLFNTYNITPKKLNEIRMYKKKIAARIKLLHQDDKAKQFESNTVKFMKMMGLKDYDGTKIVDGEAKPLYLDHPAGGVHKAGIVQIDAVCRWDDVIIVVECKRSDVPDSNYPERKDITQLEETMEKLALALHQKESKRSKDNNKIFANLHLTDFYSKDIKKLRV